MDEVEKGGRGEKRIGWKEEWMRGYFKGRSSRRMKEKELNSDNTDSTRSSTNGRKSIPTDMISPNPKNRTYSSSILQVQKLARLNLRNYFQSGRLRLHPSSLDPATPSLRGTTFTSTNSSSPFLITRNTICSILHQFTRELHPPPSALAASLQLLRIVGLGTRESVQILYHILYRLKKKVIASDCKKTTGSNSLRGISLRNTSKICNTLSLLYSDCVCMGTDKKTVEMAEGGITNGHRIKEPERETEKDGAIQKQSETREEEEERKDGNAVVTTKSEFIISLEEGCIYITDFFMYIQNHAIIEKYTQCENVAERTSSRFPNQNNSFANCNTSSNGSKIKKGNTIHRTSCSNISRSNDDDNNNNNNSPITVKNTTTEKINNTGLSNNDKSTTTVATSTKTFIPCAGPSLSSEYSAYLFDLSLIISSFSRVNFILHRPTIRLLLECLLSGGRASGEVPGQLATVDCVASRSLGAAFPTDALVSLLHGVARQTELRCIAHRPRTTPTRDPVQPSVLGSGEPSASELCAAQHKLDQNYSTKRSSDCEEKGEKRKEGIQETLLLKEEVMLYKIIGNELTSYIDHNITTTSIPTTAGNAKSEKRLGGMAAQVVRPGIRAECGGAASGIIAASGNAVALSKLSAANLTIATNAFCKAGVLHQKFFDRATKILVPAVLHELSSRQTALIAHSYVKLGLRNDPILPHLWNRFVEMSYQDCNWQAVCLAVQAFTKCGVIAVSILDTLLLRVLITFKLLLHKHLQPILGANLDIGKLFQRREAEDHSRISATNTSDLSCETTTTSRPTVSTTSNPSILNSTNGSNRCTNSTSAIDPPSDTSGRAHVGRSTAQQFVEAATGRALLRGPPVPAQLCSLAHALSRAGALYKHRLLACYLVQVAASEEYLMRFQFSEIANLCSSVGDLSAYFGGKNIRLFDGLPYDTILLSSAAEELEKRLPAGNTLESVDTSNSSSIRTNKSIPCCQSTNNTRSDTHRRPQVIMEELLRWGRGYEDFSSQNSLLPTVTTRC